MNSTASQAPMDAGTIISTAWRLYKTSFLKVLPLSLRGTAWLGFPICIGLVGVLWAMDQDVFGRELSSFLGLLGPSWIVLFLWCSAQSLGEFAAISRLVHRRLVTAEVMTEQSVAEAMRFTRSRKFSLLGSAVIQWLILGTINFIALVVAAFSVGMIFYGIGLVTGQPSPGLFFEGGAILLISTVLFTSLSVWLSMRFLVTEQALAVETYSGVVRSISRSWKLMKRHFWKAIGAVLLAMLICLPLLLIVVIVVQSILSVVLSWLAVYDPSQRLLASFVVSYLISGIIVSPFMRTVVTTLYFDIRNRKESIEA